MDQELDIDLLRTHCLEVIIEVNEHVRLLRDYAVTPGNAWLARNELSRVTRLLSDLENSIDAIKRAEM